MRNNLIQSYPTPLKDYYKVYVQSITYNQSSYIEDCLNGVAIQQTDFPFVHHVIDDCSTDGEQKIIKTYLNNNCDMENAEYYDNDVCSITIAKNKSNPNCTLAVYFLKKNMYGNPEKNKLYKPWLDACEYTALCEGDDCWIDSLKLQKQFNLLSNNPIASFVYTGFNVVDKEGNILSPHKFEQRMCKSHSGYIFLDLLVNMNYIMTLTTFFRSKVYMSILDYYYDYGFFLNASRQGYAIYLPDKTSNYRINPNSIMNTAPQSLRFKTCKIIINEINRALYDDSTNIEVKKNLYLKPTIGYILCRYINKSSDKERFLRYAYSHPSLWLYMIIGGVIRIIADSKFRNNISRL